MLLSVGVMPTRADDTVTVTFDLNGGSSSDQLVFTIPKGTSIPKNKFPTAVLEGKEFFDWFTVKSSISPSSRVTSSTRLEEDVTVYAIWDEIVERVPEEDIPKMTWKKYDKAYISFIFDDNNTDLKEFYNVITGEYGYPICAAVPAKTLESGRNIDLLHDIQNHGGEIVAHGYSHKVLNRGVLWSEADFEFAKSQEVFKEYGFNVNGIISAGGGGSEDTSTEYKRELEGITAKYFDYGTWAYGVSTQHYSERFSVNGSMKVDTLKNKLDTMIENKQWIQFTAHNTSEFPISLLKEFMVYLKEQVDAGKVEVITYKVAYEKLAIWEPTPDFGDTTYTADFYSETGVKLGESTCISGESPEPVKFFTPRGKKLVSYNTLPDGTGKSYTLELDELKLNGNIKLYAIMADDVTNDAKLPFTDISEDASYYDDIKYAYDIGLTSGVSENEFAPDMTLNRAMFVTLLHRMNFEPEAKSSVFADVPEDAYFAMAVAWANENGIVNGIDANTFAPDNVITREQLATIIYRYLQDKGINVTTLEYHLKGVSDVNDISSYASVAMNFAVGNNIISLREDGTIKPREGATRAEAISALVKTLEIFE